MREHRPKTGMRGFTFLELMVTLALISVLMAFLFPMLMQGRHTARRAACQSNLAQLGAALHLYSQDYDGRFPAVDNDWTTTTSVYARNSEVVKCPDEPPHLGKRYQPGTARKVGSNALIFSSYQYRSGLANDDPAEEPISRDWGNWHEDGVNVLYLGGNVRWKPLAESPTLSSVPRPLPSGEVVDVSTFPFAGE